MKNDRRLDSVKCYLTNTNVFIPNSNENAYWCDSNWEF